MAFDGIVIANLVKELNETIINGRISKIAQPENDELLLTIKGNSGQVRLLLSASASLPLIYLTKNNKPSPLTAPNFCMLLRKHIANGKITKIYQPQMERIINFEIEHLNELGDICHKKLIVEIMGKHSNIIFCNEEDMIIDSIKHISAQVETPSGRCCREGHISSQRHRKNQIPWKQRKNPSGQRSMANPFPYRKRFILLTQESAL